ncbi:hypothetical protein NDU88_004469 [Pleurodeles waltl]|uniref:Uncharacterized protein n=1 Tax=Pleurodeles waltl TaxID=8319 RepID=A0AAV7V594_PLEWA|nr:hypothetical protein NDU88_004469 [Pleurodeles waltl]
MSLSPPPTSKIAHRLTLSSVPGASRARSGEGQVPQAQRPRARRRSAAARVAGPATSSGRGPTAVGPQWPPPPHESSPGSPVLGPTPPLRASDSLRTPQPGCRLPSRRNSAVAWPLAALRRGALSRARHGRLSPQPQLRDFSCP